MKKSRILIAALEEMEEVLPVEEVSTEPGLDAQMLEQEETGNDIDMMHDQVEDAQDTQEVLEKMDAAETPEAAVCIAKEHFLNRLGYKAKVGMESFTATDPDFKRKIEGSLQLANEGIIESIGSAIQATFTSKASLLEQSSKVAEKLKEKGSKEENIVDPGWGRIFTHSNKKELSGSDVIKMVQAYSKLTKDSKFTSLISEITAMRNEISTELNKSTFIAKDDSVAVIKAINEKATGILESIKEVINIESVKKSDSTFKALSVEEGEKLAQAVKEMLSDTEFSSVLKKLSDSSSKISKSSFKSSYLRLAGGGVGLAADQRASSKAQKGISPSLKAIYEVVKNKNKVCFSAIQYIKASTK